MNFSDPNADKETLRQLAALLNKFFDSPESDVGFCLCVFPKTQLDAFKYTSNAPRPDVLKLLRMVLERFDPIRPLH